MFSHIFAGPQPRRDISLAPDYKKRLQQNCCIMNMIGRRDTDNEAFSTALGPEVAVLQRSARLISKIAHFIHLRLSGADQIK
jgi:hypothetical protein